ncbi:MAG: alcohol dehydrogenase catalytic domain-containing protein [Verrucomicrobiota bacterium]
MPVPHIGMNELLVKVAVCGVCPTDIKKIQYGTLPPPRIFGHETAGTIVKIGARVCGFRIGDRVALHHHVPCMDCHFCRHRAFAQCKTYKRTGITAGFEPAGGGFAEYIRVMNFVLPGVVKIPRKNSFEEGAMLEPVNTVLKAVKRLNLLPGDRTLVVGQGPIGLMFTRLLQLQGVKVLATDLMKSRLHLAKRFGAKWTMLVSKSDKVGQGSHLPVAECGESSGAHGVTRSTKSSGLDAAVIAVPSGHAVQQAFQLVRGGGQILLFAHTKRNSLAHPMGEGRGDGNSTFNLDLASICLDEKDLIGSYSSDFTHQSEVARLVFSRKLDVRKLISHHFPLTQAAAAVQLASRPTLDSLKIVVAAKVNRL